MNHVSIPKDPDSSVQLRPLVCFNEGMRSPYREFAIERQLRDSGSFSVSGLRLSDLNEVFGDLRSSRLR